MNLFEKFVENGLLQALPHTAQVRELDWLEMTRTDKRGNRYRNYYRVWDFPWGQEAMQTAPSIQFHGWRAVANHSFSHFAANYEYIALPRARADGSLGRAECGVTRIFRFNEHGGA